VKILFDQGTPVPLRKVLVAHLVVTAYELGWSELQNGDLTPYPLSLQIRNSSTSSLSAASQAGRAGPSRRYQ
jgi:hypothetical protein